MPAEYTLASALLRRSRVSEETLKEEEEKERLQESLIHVLFKPELLDLAPDIFPPHFIEAYIEQKQDQGFRSGDTWEKYLRRVLKPRNNSTLKMIARQLYSSAKADATRRTTAIHPVQFDDTATLRYSNSNERYCVFPDGYAEMALLAVEFTSEGKRMREAIHKYQQSTEAQVPDTFFEMMKCLRGVGLSQQRDAKHKYPIHGLLYGSSVSIPEKITQKIEYAGNRIITDLTSRLSNPQEALFFSVDFFLSTDGTIFIGRDVHEQQIGMGLQYCLEVDKSERFYAQYIEVLSGRVPNKKITLSYDSQLCQRNTLYQMELKGLREHLEIAGFTIEETSDSNYRLRLFGGTQGIPTSNVTELTDDKLLIDDILEKNREEFAEIGVLVPRTYRCTAAELVRNSSLIVKALNARNVFVHPTRHHGFKPFELNLESELSPEIVVQNFKRDTNRLERVSVVVMERIPNYVEYNDKKYPHEIRAYFAPKR